MQKVDSENNLWQLYDDVSASALLFGPTLLLDAALCYMWGEIGASMTE